MDVARTEAELAIAKLVEQYEGLRATVEDPATKTPENLAEYHRLNAEIAAARTAYKEAYPPPAPAGGDASPEPQTVAGGTSVQGG